MFSPARWTTESIPSREEESKVMDSGFHLISVEDLGFLVNFTTFIPLDINNCVNEDPMRPVAPLMSMFLRLNFSIQLVNSFINSIKYW